MTDIYDALESILDELRKKLPEYELEVAKCDSTIFEYEIKITDRRVKLSYSIELHKFIYNTSKNLNEAYENYVATQVRRVLVYHKKKQKTLYHISEKTFPTQFKNSVIKKIKNLAQTVYKGTYDGIEIENSVYSTEQFDLHIVKLAKRKTILRSKSEPIVYIPLYEFFTVQLFNRIFGIEMDAEDMDDAADVEPDLANEWTDINAEIMKIQLL